MAPSTPRIDWIDAVKGLTIILVVMMHTTYGVAEAAQQAPYIFNLLCEWTVPFRMPLFFLVAGLFAQKALRAPLPRFIDSKIVHFAYFYLLWSVIQIGIKLVVPHESATQVTYENLLLIPLEPFAVLWFIYALAVFFAVMRLTRDLHPAVMIVFALVLYFTRLDTGWTMPDEFAWRFIYFVAGIHIAPYVFRLAAWAMTHKSQGTITGAVLLAAVAGSVFSGLIAFRAIELATGFIGAGATIMLVAILAAKGYAKPLTYVGSRSLYVFLAFFLPMAVVRVLMIKLGFENGDLITLMSMITAVILPLVGYRLLRDTPLAFFFERPAIFKLNAERVPMPSLNKGRAPEAS